MSDDIRTDRDASRRDFLKKAGIAAGATAWSIPTLQVIRMAGAGAQTADTSVTDPTTPPACKVELILGAPYCVDPDGIDDSTAWDYEIVTSCACDGFDWIIGGTNFGEYLPAPRGRVLAAPEFDGPVYVVCKPSGIASNTVRLTSIECGRPD